MSVRTGMPVDSGAKRGRKVRTKKPLCGQCKGIKVGAKGKDESLDTVQKLLKEEGQAHATDDGAVPE